MTREESGLHSHGSVSFVGLRRQIEELLPLDASLDAFCIDYAPQVYRQFSAGMERTRKVNLLLTSLPLEQLQALLQHATCTQPESESRSAPILSASRRPQRAARYRWLAMIMGLATVSGFLLYVLSAVFRGTARDERARVASSDAPQPAPPPQPGLAAVLTSEPTGALVYALPSGRFLGRTPWTPGPGFNNPHLCLRSPGYTAAHVTLEPRDGPSGLGSIHVRLQQQTRARPERELTQETCNVPTPLLE